MTPVFCEKPAVQFVPVQPCGKLISCLRVSEEHLHVRRPAGQIAVGLPHNLSDATRLSHWQSDGCILIVKCIRYSHMVNIVTFS